MSSHLRSAIAGLASSFASEVLAAIRGASLDDILVETRGGGSAPVKRGPGRPRAVETKAHHAVAKPAKRGPKPGGRRRAGRLGRRSANDIAGVVEQIVHLLASHPQGLRAEQIRSSLKIQAKELPRPLAEALESHRIVKQGQKRATTYFAKGGGRGGSTKATPTRRGAASGGRKAKAGPGRRKGGRRAAKHTAEHGAASETSKES